MKWKIELRGDGPVKQGGDSDADARLVELVKNLKNDGHSIELATIEAGSATGQVEPPAVCPYCYMEFAPSWDYRAHLDEEKAKAKAELEG